MGQMAARKGDPTGHEGGEGGGAGLPAAASAGAAFTGAQTGMGLGALIGSGTDVTTSEVTSGAVPGAGLAGAAFVASTVAQGSMAVAGAMAGGSGGGAGGGGIVVQTGSGNVFIGGAPAARASLDTAMCDGHAPNPIADGSPTVWVNGAKLARVGDPLECGGKIVAGHGRTFIGNGRAGARAAATWASAAVPKYPF